VKSKKRTKNFGVGYSVRIIHEKRAPKVFMPLDALNMELNIRNYYE
jgi:hypothetical protein